jgi:hypothetical protein
MTTLAADPVSERRIALFLLLGMESETTEKIELEPSTPPDPKHDQFQMMFKAFHAMGLNPQGSTAEELDKWITKYNNQMYKSTILIQKCTK